MVGNQAHISKTHAPRAAAGGLTRKAAGLWKREAQELSGSTTERWFWQDITVVKYKPVQKSLNPVAISPWRSVPEWDGKKAPKSGRAPKNILELEAQHFLGSSIKSEQ